MAVKVYTSNSVDRIRDIVTTVGASVTLSSGQSGSTFLVGTDALVITLPAVGAQGSTTDKAPAGTSYTFVNSAADGAAIITVSPAAADGINGTMTLAASVVELSGTVNKDLINTKASATTGNSVTIVSSGTAGTTAWMVTSSTGIWASEA